MFSFSSPSRAFSWRKRNNSASNSLNPLTGRDAGSALPWRARLTQPPKVLSEISKRRAPYACVGPRSNTSFTASARNSCVYCRFGIDVFFPAILHLHWRSYKITILRGVYFRGKFNVVAG